MTDHPFDEIAVEAAAKEYYQHHRSVNEKPWEELHEGIRTAYIENVLEFLTAACNSMKERGKATNGDYVPSGENGAGYSNMGSLDFWRGIFNFTIFRHGE